MAAQLTTCDELQRDMADVFEGLNCALAAQLSGGAATMPGLAIARLVLRIPCFFATIPTPHASRPFSRVLSLEAPTLWARWFGHAKPFEIIVIVRDGQHRVRLQRASRPHKTSPRFFSTPHNVVLVVPAGQESRFDRLTRTPSPRGFFASLPWRR